MIISMYIAKPYKLTFLKFIKQYLSAEDIGSYLALSWSFVENPSRDVNVSKREIIRLFRSADKKTLLTDEEREVFNNLDESIEIYRGVTTKGLNAAKGLSWTLSIEKARYFANRFKRGGYVYKAHINKEHILAYITDRSEDEIVAD